jgi:replication-associated recombination protein RarA
MALQGRSVSELLRPRQLSDLSLPLRVINRLQRMIDERSLMHMVFYGRPGIGKTSAARILGRSLEAKAAVELNGSYNVDERQFERNAIGEIVRFAWTRDSVRQKLCFIDDVDHIPKRAQATLQFLIDDYSDIRHKTAPVAKCRFLFAVNDISKGIIPTLRSRLLSVCFNPVGADKAEIKERLFRRYADVLSREGIHFEEKRLIELIGNHFPDLRKIANRVQFEFSYDEQEAR